jgi:hypothetical protein
VVSTTVLSLISDLDDRQSNRRELAAPEFNAGWARRVVNPGVAGQGPAAPGSSSVARFCGATVSRCGTRCPAFRVLPRHRHKSKED